ncbi:hypothetical protein Hanom_Chr13g01190901 [Helianthus anomalus]
MYKKRAPELRLMSIFPLKSVPRLRFLYTLRLMSHKAIYFAPRCASRLRHAFLSQCLNGSHCLTWLCHT